MPTNDKEIEFINETKKEVHWWMIAAWTLPFVALGILFFIGFIGWDQLYKKILTVIGVIFFSIAVFWWWWAIHKITFLIDTVQRTIKNFDIIKEELINFKKNLRNNR